MEESGSGILDTAARVREQTSFKTTMRFSHFCSIYKVYFVMLPSLTNNSIYIKSTTILHIAVEQIRKS